MNKFEVIVLICITYFDITLVELHTSNEPIIIVRTLFFHDECYK